MADMTKERLFEIGFVVLTGHLHKDCRNFPTFSNNLEHVLREEAKDAGILPDEAQTFARMTTDVIRSEEITG